MRSRPVIIITLLSGFLIWICFVLLKTGQNTKAIEKVKFAQTDNSPQQQLQDSAIIKKAEKTFPSLAPSKLQEVVEKASKQKLGVSGQVLDQYGKPVSEAEITYSINNRILKTPTRKRITTDETGYFNYSIRASSSYISAEKNGYYSDSRSRINLISPGDKTITLILNKAGKTESLRLSSKGIKLMRNGTPVGVNLRKVSKSDISSADIVVRAKKDNDGSVFNGEVDPWSWRCEIMVPGGGIVLRESEDPYDFKAPEDGYQETFVYEKRKEMKGWTSKVKDEFYVKLADSTYTLIEFYFTSFNEDPYMKIKSYYNPSGSKNLEFDKSKQIK